MTECEACGRPHAIERDGRALCTIHWVEQIDRGKSTGVVERVKRDRERRQRTVSAVYDPAQMHHSEFINGRIESP